MSNKTHDLVITTGEYQDRQTGQTKRRYQTVGALMQGDNGPFIMLAKWFNPAGAFDSRGGENLLISCFEPRQQGQQAQQQRPAQQQQPAPQNNQHKSSGGEEWDSDIPFDNTTKILAKHHLI